MDKIDDIRRLGRNGASVASISWDTGVSEPTVRKHLARAGPPERPPEIGGAPGSPCSSPFEAPDRPVALGRQALLAQAGHTAKRVYDRPVAEEGFEGPTDGPKVREAQARGSSPPVSTPARRRVPPARLAARRVPGRLRPGGLPSARRGHPGPFPRGLVPHSNVGFAQVFWGETAECVCQGLKSDRVRRRRAAARRLRQRHRGRPQGRRA